MNNIGQTFFIFFMLALVIIVIALGVSGVVKQVVDDARNTPSGDTLGLDCTNASISDVDKAVCVTSDISIFWFIAGLIGIAGIIIAVGRII